MIDNVIVHDEEINTLANYKMNVITRIDYMFGELSSSDLEITIKEPQSPEKSQSPE
jgi:hypothetical protein